MPDQTPRTNKPPQPTPWIFALLLAVAILLFLKFASDVNKGETLPFDEWIITSLRPTTPQIQNIERTVLARVMRDLTSLGSIVVLATITSLISGLLVLQRRWRHLAFLLASFGGGLFLNWSLKHLYARARPDLVPHLDQVLNHSFPSGHALVATVVYCALGMIFSACKPTAQKAYILACFALLILTVGCSRIYLGVHYPSDVAAGWTIGLLWTSLCRTIIGPENRSSRREETHF